MCEMKTCTKCGEEKELSEFSKHGRIKSRRSHCKECVRIYNKDFYKNNAEREKERNKAYRKENPEKADASTKAWRDANPDKMKATRKAHYNKNAERLKSYAKKYRKKNPKKVATATSVWKKANPEKVRAIENNRRAREAGLEGSYTDKEWKKLCKKYKNRCVCCGEKLPLTQDHVIPITWPGSTNDISNVQPLCVPCNSSKGNHHATDYRKDYNV